MSRRRSLAQRHPKRVEVPIGIALATGLLVVGQLLPIMRIEKLLFWHDDYSIITGAWGLLTGGHAFLGIVIFFFSVLFPFAKLIGLAVLWLWPMDKDDRRKLAWWLGAMGRWSMLDVFVVAVTIVLSASTALAGVEPDVGLYVFCAAVFLSMVVAVEVDLLARRR